MAAKSDGTFVNKSTSPNGTSKAIRLDIQYLILWTCLEGRVQSEFPGLLPTRRVLVECLCCKFIPGDPENPSHRIPIEELSRPDPILFYSEIPLFEDELHDNGTTSLLTRVRVMPTSFFILSRFFLRVDGVLFRIFDTRIYHPLSSDPPLIVRETSGWEVKYDSIKQFLPTPDLSPLNDPNFIARVITSMPKSKTQDPNHPDSSGWKALGTTVEVCHLDVNPALS